MVQLHIEQSTGRITTRVTFVQVKQNCPDQLENHTCLVALWILPTTEHL